MQFQRISLTSVRKRTIIGQQSENGLLVCGGNCMNIIHFMKQIEQLRKEQDAIYHSVAARCGLSDSAMWVLYMVSEPDAVYTQQELCREYFYPKQTINTTIAHLVKSGYVILKAIPGTRNQKKILLTETGKALAASTTDLLREAESCAYGRLSGEELASYWKMTEKLTAALREETQKRLFGKEMHDEGHTVI